MDHNIMATPNGYSSDCGAPCARPYNYPYATPSDESSGDASHLSFLYDRAQGNSYTQQSPGGAATHYAVTGGRNVTPEINNHQSNHISATETPPSEYSSNDIGQGVSRATPAPAYPYTSHRGLYTPGVSQNTESSACPTGSYAADRWSNHPQHYTPSSAEAQRGEGEVLERQMSNMRVCSQSQGGPVTQPSNETKNQPRSIPVLVEPHQAPLATGARTIDRQKTPGSSIRGPGQYYNPSTPATLDPRRNYIRQKIPWRDINAARKFSMPILSRPCVQVREVSFDDQSADGIGEVDKSSVRQLLREGDEIGNYEQKSIRYTGKTNPSKSFRLLQSVTGSTDDESIERHQNERKQRRRQKREEILAAAADDKDALKDADDVVDISYVGSKIPSRTFRFLQEAIGARDQQAGQVTSPSSNAFQNHADSPFGEQPTRTIKVVHLRPQKSLENLIGDF